MGAKLSKKKKGYCLGAGKDGESTDTTEVEQKETEAQAGHKDAAEPNGEKTPTDQTLNNGASEEQNARAEKINSTEVPIGETTKDHLNKDQKSESKPSAEQKIEPKKDQDKPEHAKSSNTSQQMATEGGKVRSQPDEKPLTELDKESVAKNEPTQESKPVTEQKSSEPKQENQSVTKQSAPVPEMKEVAKPVPDPETKVKVEKMEKVQTPVVTTEHPSEQAPKEPTPILASVKVPEKIPEIVETLVSEIVSVEPVQKETATEQVEPEPVVKVVEPEIKVSLPETVTAKDLVKPELDLAPVTESVESKVSEEPRVPEVKSVEPMANPDLAPCPEPKQLSKTKQEPESLPEPLPSNEVPDSTAQVEENVKNPETLGNVDLVIETQAATAESAPSAEKNPVQDVAENCPSEEIPESKAQNTISKEQEVEDKEMQKEVEEKVLDKQPTEHGSLEKDCKDKEEVALDTSKNENDQVASEDTTVNHPAQDKNSEDKAENFKVMGDKYGVGNGLPVKEEVKVHLENGCDKDLHELNGPGECREIEVCNE